MFAKQQRSEQQRRASKQRSRYENIESRSRRAAAVLVTELCHPVVMTVPTGGVHVTSRKKNNRCGPLEVSISVLYFLVAASMAVAIAAIVQVANEKQQRQRMEQENRPADDASYVRLPQADWPEEGILPNLVGRYLGNFTYQSFDGATSKLLPMDFSSDRLIAVRRNENFDKYIAYEYDDNGIPNVGGLHLPRYADEYPRAYLKAGTASVSWEQWISKCRIQRCLNGHSRTLCPSRIFRSQILFSLFRSFPPPAPA